MPEYPGSGSRTVNEDGSLGKMKRIASFSINHDALTPGMYISRIDGDCVTYDLRMKTPNAGDYLDQKGLHTLEHLLATYLRNTDSSDDIVYVGPMGCRTGFYIVMRDTVPAGKALELIRAAYAFSAAFEGDVPGAAKRECGNYLEHDLAEARREAAAYLQVLEKCSESTMAYPE